MSYPPPTKGKIIVFGILFWYPLAGVTYQFLHYLIGLRKLGYDPYYIEDSGRWIYDPRLNDFSPDVTGNLELVVPVLKPLYDYAWFVGFGASGTLHLVLMKLFPPQPSEIVEAEAA